MAAQAGQTRQAGAAGRRLAAAAAAGAAVAALVAAAPLPATAAATECGQLLSCMHVAKFSPSPIPSVSCSTVVWRTGSHV